MATSTIQSSSREQLEGRETTSKWRPLLIGLLIFAALAITHRSLLFVEPWHEHSDVAVGSLNIERARHFQSIVGNYSRFGFCHPGPAFEYVYALGEQLFYHVWPLTPSRHNAHVLAGLILQCFFFTAALSVADRWIQRPLFLPLVLLTLTIHLSLAGNAFISVWQPHAMLMPFFCFVVCAASVAAGRTRDLPLAVLAACFLVHGHVSQPLYVVPLFLLACGVAARRAQLSPPGIRGWLKTHRAAWVISLGCIAVFLVPMAIDLSAGANSNLAKIIEFKTSYDSAGKPLWRALVYFCAFFGYVKKTEFYLSATGPNRAEEIGEHIASYFVWAAAIGIALAYAYRLWMRRSGAERSFVLSLTGFTTLAFLLSLYWGTLQVGRVYQYNGYVFYSILSCIMLLTCAAASMLTPPKPRIWGALLTLAAVVIAWQRQYTEPQPDYSTNQIPSAVQQALESDPLPAAPKYLVFDHTDWGEAASIALALQRAGLAFRADVDWGPKFSPDARFEPQPPVFDLQGMSTWRLSRRGPSDRGHILRHDLRVYFKPLPLDPSNAIIDCGEKGNLELYKLFGFNSPVGPAAWTIRPFAGLVFESPRMSSDISVTFFAEPFALPEASPRQPVTLIVNGRSVFEGVLTQPGAITARIPADVWNAQSPATMVLHLPEATTAPGAVRVRARDLGGMIDERMFGWRIERIVFEAAR